MDDNQFNRKINGDKKKSKTNRKNTKKANKQKKK